MTRVRSIISAITFWLLTATAFAQPHLIAPVNGYTLTGPAGNQAQLLRFDALVFDHGKVVFTGSQKQANDQFPDAKLIDGQNKTLLPGLIDAHGHILGLGLGLSKVDLRGVGSAKEAANKVLHYHAQNQEASWIIGRGWNQVLWPDKQFPNKQTLDQLNIDKPIVLSRVDGHAIWVNSAALKIAGINRNTPDPEGGQILHDSLGEPTGVLVDNAEFLVNRFRPEPNPLQVNFALDKAFQHLLSLGITSAHDAGIDDDLYQLYQQRLKQNALAIRVYAMLDGSSIHLTRWLEHGIIADPNDFLSIRSVKLYADGALGSRGAAMLEPYSDQPDHTGLLVTEPKRLKTLIEQILKKGFQANVHAIGDKGNRVVLDGFEQAYTTTEGRVLRNRIEHAQVIALDDLKRLKTLDLIASMQPTHATSDKNMAEDRVGSTRIKGAYAWRRLLNQGTIIASGSDFPVELANPFHGLHAAVTRQDHNNLPEQGWKPEQKMTLPEALRSFTLDAAYAAHQEATLGSLEPGKWADFILIDKDPFETPESTLWQIEVLQTWIGGEKRYQKPL